MLHILICNIITLETVHQFIVFKHFKILVISMYIRWRVFRVCIFWMIYRLKKEVSWKTWT
jgi:hypothetical protein